MGDAETPLESLQEFYEPFKPAIFAMIDRTISPTILEAMELMGGGCASIQKNVLAKDIRDSYFRHVAERYKAFRGEQ